MVQNRVLPCLLVQNGKLVKTEKFKNPQYVGDPVNAIKIFNEKEVDELMLCDISEGRAVNGTDIALIQRIADECFMPLTYGGGITKLEQIKTILKSGVEKVVLNSALEKSVRLLNEGASVFGAQCMVASMDVKKDWLGRYKVCYQSGKRMTEESPEAFVERVVQSGAGEILVSNIDRESSWKGLDVELIKSVTSVSTVPIIVTGGAGSTDHIKEAIIKGGASAVALGSMAVFQQKGLGVLINFPNEQKLKEINYLKK
ncbi:MAG: imidazole glycerol phosphate synthase subunit HisF [Saprospiraceae bacterium]|nr:imidazole glycerol phosphate synthase subunit HisF [Saprospiraceae bacterium]